MQNAYYKTAYNYNNGKTKSTYNLNFNLLGALTPLIRGPLDCLAGLLPGFDAGALFDVGEQVFDLAETAVTLFDVDQKKTSTNKNKEPTVVTQSLQTPM